MAYKIIKVKRETRCRKCSKDIRVRKHMIKCGGTLYCLNCGDGYLKQHREHYKIQIAEINKAFRNLVRYHKERVTLKLIDNRK